MRAVITVLLLTFVAVSLAYLVGHEAYQRGTIATPSDGLAVGKPFNTSKDSKTNSPLPAEDHMVLVYYFHGTARCRTCRAIEAYTEEALREGFPEELGSGALRWQAVNLDDADNRHFIERYQLATRSVVVAEIDKGIETRSIKLERVWELVKDKEVFIDYITENTGAFLAGKHD